MLLTINIEQTEDLQSDAFFVQENAPMQGIYILVTYMVKGTLSG